MLVCMPAAWVLQGEGGHLLGEGATLTGHKTHSPASMLLRQSRRRMGMALLASAVVVLVVFIAATRHEELLQPIEARQNPDALLGHDQ